MAHLAIYLKIWFSMTLLSSPVSLDQNIPIVVTTWNFINSTNRAWQVLSENGNALDAIEQGASVCEAEQCDGTVGFGGSPDENSETTLDAMMMDGKTMNVGAVAALRRIKGAVSVARHVLEHTQHSLLAGELATQFALQMGFHEESLTTQTSKTMWKQWHNDNKCQPNFWIDVTPDPRSECGPYTKPSSQTSHERVSSNINIGRLNHDTIGMVAIDNNGDVAAGTSTNGAKHKIPGMEYQNGPTPQTARGAGAGGGREAEPVVDARVGDSPIPGSGAYADNEVGGATATGDGDVMLRFLPSFLAVEEMRRGAAPREAAATAVARIAHHYPHFMGAVVALTRDGRHGAACHGIDSFPYVVHDSTSTKSEIVYVKC